MAKRLNGVIVKVGMKDTVVVEITRRTPHPLYRKLIKRSSTFKADTKEVNAALGDTVTIVETKPISKDKHFKIEKVLQEKAGKK